MNLANSVNADRKLIKRIMKELKRGHAMDWFEIIHIRLFSQKELQAAMQAYSQMSLPDLRDALKRVRLLQDVLLDTDLRIVIEWHGKATQKAKSALGLQLASAFNEFGRINHIVCKECTISERSR
jgi:hypothetical protein